MAHLTQNPFRCNSSWALFVLRPINLFNCDDPHICPILGISFLFVFFDFITSYWSPISISFKSLILIYPDWDPFQYYLLRFNKGQSIGTTGTCRVGQLHAIVFPIAYFADFKTSIGLLAKSIESTRRTRNSINSAILSTCINLRS